MTTLRELLDECRVVPNSESIIALIESWAYGGERECEVFAPMPEGWVWKGEAFAPPTCPTCHGTGKVGEPGLVERIVDKAITNARNSPDEPDYIDALTAELGG